MTPKAVLNRARAAGIRIAAAESCTRQALETAENELQKRLNACKAAARPYLLDMYANPVTSALNALSTADAST